MMNENIKDGMDQSMCMMYAKKKMLGGLVIGIFLGWIVTWLVMMPKNNSWQQSTANITPTTTASQSFNPKQLALYEGMDKLWLEHVWWTREYLKANVDNSKDMALVAARLLQNQQDIGNAIKTYYGDAAGEQLVTLLKVHIQGAVDLVNAAKAGNKTKIATANTAWYMNADQIASFLAGANPNWDLKTLTTMMHTHLDLTKQEAIDLINKNDQMAIADFQKVEDEIIMMADSFSQGIIMQYPALF